MRLSSAWALATNASDIAAKVHSDAMKLTRFGKWRIRIFL